MSGDRDLTLHGHDTHCGLCGLRVYGLWVDREPPPPGCSNGLDSAPWSCSFVLHTLKMAVFRVDQLGQPMLPHHEAVIALVGKDHADRIMRYVRKWGRAPRAGRPLPPSYERRTIQ